MSTRFATHAPAPACTSAQFPHLLAGLVLASPAEREVLTLLGLPRHCTPLRADSAGPLRVGLRLDEPLIACIELQGAIYPLRQPRVAEDHCVEYIAAQRSLWLKYQQILGSRLLFGLTVDEARRFETALQHLSTPQINTPQPDRLPGEDTEAPSELLEEIGALTIRGQRLELPSRQLAHYARIKALVLAAGGKYARNGFNFAPGCDAPSLLAQLCAGEPPNPRKERQAFFTPSALAERTVQWLAHLAGDLHGQRILEPSAGEGALADAARAAGAHVMAVEIHGPSAQVLRDKGHEVMNQDFLSLHPDELGPFDAILANPPFSRDQDIVHINHMWHFLRPGGVLVSLMSPGWRTGSTRVRSEFRAFTEQLGARVEPLPDGSFKASGTDVSAVRVALVKPLRDVGGNGSNGPRG